ncbi:MAG: hypothetical protein CVV13_14635 [Gammaproteobacteria bacterium HGW-Gammaproteobacteria-3]|nr:MAG: hypothetical protein CVV13_14635 [Gammaproteobacteria bacterium HGW-Gammaproteobacteria-3]
MIKTTLMAAATAAALSGCAANSVCEDYQNMLAVETRVQNRWQDLIENKHQSVYTYFVGSYKAMVSEQDYLKTVNPRIQWKSVDITRTRCSQDTCDVHVTAKYHMPPQFGLPQGVDASSMIVEKWLRKDGEWWFIPPLKK